MKNFRALMIFVFFFLLAACNNANGPANPAKTFSDTAYKAVTLHNTERGRELFQEKCQACHGLNGNYRNNNAADLSVSVLDSISIINTIKTGKGAMPMFDRLFPDSDLAQIELYVKTLRK